MTPQPTGSLVFKTASDLIPCQAGEVCIELVDQSASGLDPELIRNAAAGVLHYFRVLGRESITVAEFSEALIKVLRGFGMDVDAASERVEATVVAEADLRQLASESGKAFELAFFPRLREEIDAQVRQSPQVIRFVGLRSCVKQLAGAQRWSSRCQNLNDQIVDYLRSCLTQSAAPRNCALVVS